MANDDVTVSGGGPGGLLAAIILARAGVRVRLFERATFPKDKLCGDTLNPGALAALARHVDIAALRPLSLPIQGMLMTGPYHARVRGHYPPGVVGRAITRRQLDAWLASEAALAGVAVEENRCVIEAIGDARAVAGVRVRTPRGGSEVHAARLTIAADGRRSRLAASLGLSRQPTRPRRWAFGAYFEGVEDVGAMGEMHVRPGCYLGIAPTPSGLTNVCYVTSPASHSAGWQSPDRLMMEATLGDPHLVSRFARARRVTPIAVLGPLAVDVPVPGSPGLLLAGDAAGFIDPMTGDGLRFAIEGAELAAAVALEVLDGRLADSDAPAELARRRHARFAHKWRFDRLIRRLVDARGGIAVTAVAARLLPRLFSQLIRYGGDCGIEPAAIGAPPFRRERLLPHAPPSR